MIIHDGTLVGINAVKDGTIAETGQDVVLKIASSGQTDLYVMFNWQVGANNEVPQYGDQVVITYQYRETGASSSWQASLSSGEEYTQSNRGASGTLTVKVCSLETGSPGSARVLVYATGHATLSCDSNNNTNNPTAAPVRSPTAAPVVVNTNNPTTAPMRSPTAAPVVVVNTNNPTIATVGSPTAAPVVAVGCQDSASKFAFRGKKKNCKFVAQKSDGRCQKEAAVADFCPVTCQKSQCTCYDTAARFQMPNGRQKSCGWATKKSSLKEKRCRNIVIRSNCPIACGVCQG